MIKQEMGTYELFTASIDLIKAALRYRVFMKKSIKPRLGTQHKLLSQYRAAAKRFSRQRK